jgi:hypothetical protein
MAQTGYTPISIYYSATATNTPTAGNLVAGELAINTADGKLFYKDSAGVVQVIAGKGGAGVAGGSTTQVQYNSSGSLAGSANMTFSGTALTLANDASISGLTVGKGGGAVASNTAVGVGIFQGSATGTSNTAVGYNSLFSISTGSSNTGVGRAVLGSNTTGGFNTAFGHDSLGANSTASNNTAVGYQAGYSNITGTGIMFAGYQAGYNTTGSYSTFVGFQAGKANTSGENTAYGANALLQNTTGTANTALGGTTTSISGALASNTTGGSNVGVGVGALSANTTASNNTAVGYQAGYSNTGGDNTFVGYYAGKSITSATQTVCLGAYSGQNTTGTNNTFLGYGSGYLVTTGTKNTVIGCYQGNTGGLDIRTASNRIVLSDGDGNPRGVFDNSGNYMVGAVTKETSGVTIYGTKANGTYVKTTGTCHYWITNDGLGTGAGTIATIYNDTSIAGTITVLSNTTAYTSVSDYRLKENIAPMTGALDKVAQLKPVTYTWKNDGVVGQGFIAHELQAVVPNCVVGEKDAVNEDGSIKAQSIDTSFLVATLTAAIQELKAEFDAYKATHP